jgi:xanthine dehydrogenase accessory factor
MLELAGELLPRLRAGSRIAAVTVTSVARSAPRGVGATMAVVDTGEVIGSISGGCVESDAVLLALEAIATGRGRAARFGFTDEQAHAAGLACGGTIEVVAYPVRADDPLAMAALQAAERDEPASIGLAVGGDDIGRLRPVEWADVTTAGTDQTRADASAPPIASVLTLTHMARPRMIVFGAGDHAAALCRAAAVSGFAVTVCDSWALLVTPERFPDAAHLICEVPHEYLRREASGLDSRAVVCVLTHDERLDVPALREALALPIAFVGALGARSTVEHRGRLLRDAGVSEAQLARLHSPLGLDLGGSTPEETAVSILAEIIAARHSASGLPLRDGSGPIHRTDRLDDVEHVIAASCAVAPPEVRA